MADWVIVVDDDMMNLKMAGHILSQNHMCVTALKSGQALLDYVKEHEYEVIKNHPVMGARILKNIKEMPALAIGARWHHEQYSDNGYPDGLRGNDIPEEARMIAVADAYDAMSSRRSYRDVLPQGIIREEIEKGKGTQFDPKFADIMLAMIDEDIEFKMREQ